jgi:nucleotide-binding universal stress UspA family protein
MGAELTLTRVATMPARPASARTASAEPALDREVTGVQAEEAARALDAVADDIGARLGTRPNVCVAQGDDPAARLLAAARALACDLIVIGAAPRAGLSDALHAGTRDALVEQADCPVMVVPPGAAPPTGECVAVAFETSSASGGAAAVAARLASALEGCLTVIHVLADPRSYSQPVLPMHRAVRGVVEAALDGAELDLRHVSAYRLPVADLAQTVAVVQPALLVVAAPTRANWRNLGRPSLSAQLLRRALCPVVVVPEGAAVRAKKTTLAVS